MRTYVGTILAAIGLLSASSYAGVLRITSLENLATKSEVIVVGEVLKVEKVGEEKSRAGRTLAKFRATAKVFRGIRTADARPAGLDEVIIEYSGDEPGVIMLDGGDSYPFLAAGQVLVLPLKRREVATEQTWTFTEDNFSGVTLPAVKAELKAPATTAKEFIYREIAGNMAFGDGVEVARGAMTASLAGVPPIDAKAAPAMIAMLEAQPMDVSRWRLIAAATFTFGGVPDFDAGNFLARDESRETDPRFKVARFAARQAKFEQAEQLLTAMIENQEMHPQGVAAALKRNKSRAGLILNLEEQALGQDRPGAITTVFELVQQPDFESLRPAALAASRRLVGASVKAGPRADAFRMDFPLAIQALMREGSDADFAFLLEQVRAYQRENPTEFEQFLANVWGGPESRALEVCRIFIDLNTPVVDIWRKGQRLSDWSGLQVQTVTKRDFGLKAGDSVEQRDQALGRIRDWFKSR